jgi:hypothetical protein
LENINVLGETPWSVFLANRKSIKQGKKFMSDGNNIGKGFPALIKFLRDKISQGLVGIQCLDLGTTQYRTSLKFLCRRNHHPVLVIEAHFMYANK